MSRRELAEKALMDQKSSWIALGRTLVEINTEGDFRTWGFKKFSDYVKQELGLTLGQAKMFMSSYDYIKATEPTVLENEDSYIPDVATISKLVKAKEREALSEEEAQILHRDAFSGLDGDKRTAAALKGRRTAGEIDVLEDISKETKKVKSLCKKLFEKICITSSFSPEMVEKVEAIYQEIDAVEA